MLDDELLPKNHPLQLYLEELELNEKTPDTHHERISKAPATGFLLRKNATKYINNALSFVHPMVFGLAEHFRQRILENAHSYIAPSDAAIMRHMYHAPKYHTRASLFILSFGFILPFSFVLTGFTRTNLLFGFILMLPSIAAILSVLCLYFIHSLLRKCTMQMKSVQLRLRTSLGFLQELDHHSSFGVSHLSLLNQNVWSCPILQRQLGRCLRVYSEQLINSSLDLNGHTSLFSDEFCCGLSSIELKPLRERICSEELTYVLRELKMLREVSTLVESDFINKIIRSICVAPIQSALFWIRLTTMLRSLLRNLNELEQPLDKLERLCDYLQSGEAESDDSETHSTIAAEAFRNSTSSMFTSADRLTRTLLMHLLVAVKNTRELSKLVGEHCAKDEVPDQCKTMLEHLRCQLDACSNTREELEKLFYPDGSADSEASSNDGDHRQQIFTFKSIQEATACTTLKAQDPDPEDDVLEDFAVGEDSAEEDESKVNDQLEEDVNPIVPLHSSVLKELRTAIAYRRLTMEEREQRALRRRAQAIQPHDQLKSVAPDKRNKSCSETVCAPCVEAVSATTHPKEASPVARESTNNSPDGDSTLDSFFSAPLLANGNVPPEQTQRDLRRRCSWQAQSAVIKRTNQFRKASTAHPINHCSVSTNGTLLRSSYPAAQPSRIPLPGIVPVQLNPSISGARLPLKPFLCGNSLASALLAQRRKAGYVEEEAFIAIGTGEEALPDLPIPEDSHPANSDVQS